MTLILPQCGDLFFDCALETLRYKKLILGRVIWSGGVVVQCCDLDLIFDLAGVALTLKIFYGLYLGNYMMHSVDAWQGEVTLTFETFHRFYIENHQV